MHSRLHTSSEHFPPVSAPVVFLATDWDRGFG